MIRSVLKGTGSALPRRVMTHEELAQLVDTSDEWIRERTGICTRYIAGEGETTGTLATDAARAALADAGIAASEVDQGREVFRHAVTNLAEVLREVLEDTALSPADIDWVVPHQANLRILDATARKLGLPIEKVVVTVDRHANTSAASVPLAFDAARRDGRIKDGDLVMLEAMGGGFTWGASLLRV